MTTITTWIDATLQGHDVPLPVSTLPAVRWNRAWWMALMQAQDRHPGVTNQAWMALWRRLPAQIAPDDRLDGKPVLNHLMGLPGHRGAALLNRAFQVWSQDQVAQALPRGPAAEPLDLDGPHRWAHLLLERLMPLTGSRGQHPDEVPDGWALLTRRLIERSDDRHEHWRLRVWQIVRWRDAARSPDRPSVWISLINRMRAQGMVEQPLRRPLAMAMPGTDVRGSPVAGPDAPWSGTLDLMLLGLLNNRKFCAVPWASSPWAAALEQARDERRALPGWPASGQRLTRHLWDLLAQHLRTLPTDQHGTAYDGWRDRVHRWQEDEQLRAVLAGQPVVSAPARRRL